MQGALWSRRVLAALLAVGTTWLAGCGHSCPFCRHSHTGGSGPALAAATVPTAGGTSSISENDPYGGQRTCPVTGAILGASGPAVAVNVHGQPLYVCCAGCAAKVQANPDPYLAKAAADRAAAGHVGTATSYGGQKHCPVTGEELDPAGGAVPVAVRGETIYVCCEGCAAKVKANPDAYLSRVRAERGGVAASP